METKQITMGVVKELYELWCTSQQDPGEGGVRYGCDCGCGGDDTEGWELMEQEASAASQALQEKCEEHGVKIDV